MIYLNYIREVIKMIEIPIGVSNHHVHLTHDVIEKLFGKGYTLTVRIN